MEEQEKKTYRVLPGKFYANLKEGDTVKLTAAEAAPFLEELEEVSEGAPDSPAPAEPTA